jgi:hypothetical protein
MCCPLLVLHAHTHTLTHAHAYILYHYMQINNVINNKYRWLYRQTKNCSRSNASCEVKMSWMSLNIETVRRESQLNDTSCQFAMQAERRSTDC